MKNDKISSTKIKNYYTFIIWSVLLATLPVVICLIRFLATGDSFAEIWPAGSTWNDEAFYFKQTEGIVTHGVPQGYFGYNESRAQLLSFGAWVPIILAPQALFGKIFGFGVFTPFIFNICIMACSLLIFGLLAKIELGAMSSIYLSLFVFIPLSRFTFSYMPEIMIISLCIVLFGLYLSAVEKPHFVKDLLMYLILVYLVILRPYLAVLFLFPVMAAFRRHGKTKLLFIFLCLLCIGAALWGYSFFTDKFTAPYMEDIYTDWFHKVFTHGPRTVYNEVMERLRYNFALMGFRMQQSVDSLDAVGGYYTVYIILSFMVLLSSPITLLSIKLQASEEEKSNSSTYQKVFLYILVFLAQASVLLAMAALYNIADGYRHLICFIVLDILLLLSEKNIFASFKFFSVGVCIVLSVFFFLVKGDIPDSYSIPTLDRKDPKRTELALSQEKLKKEMPLTEGISWDNTVDIMYLPEADLGVYYAVPAGYGINMCERSFLFDNISSLKSGFVIIPAGDALTDILSRNGYVKLTDITGGYSVYKRSDR